MSWIRVNPGRVSEVLSRRDGQALVAASVTREVLQPRTTTELVWYAFLGSVGIGNTLVGSYGILRRLSEEFHRPIGNG